MYIYFIRDVSLKIRRHFLLNIENIGIKLGEKSRLFYSTAIESNLWLKTIIFFNESSFEANNVKYINNYSLSINFKRYFLFRSGNEKENIFEKIKNLQLVVLNSFSWLLEDMCSTSGKNQTLVQKCD